MLESSTAQLSSTTEHSGDDGSGISVKFLEKAPSDVFNVPHVQVIIPLTNISSGGAIFSLASEGAYALSILQVSRNRP